MVVRSSRVARIGRAALVLVAAAVVLAATACSGEDSSSSLPRPKPGFCEAAQRYDKRVERGASITEQITILEKLARNAPKDVKADADLFLARMQAYQAASNAERRKLQGDPLVAQAVDAVNRRAQNGCDFFQRQPGSGL